MNLLITSIGKRIQLVEHLKSRFYVVGVDASDLNPARFYVQKFYKIPKCKEPRYVRELLEICKKEQITLLIPLYEAEFEPLNEARLEFEAIGVHLILSDKEVIQICNDKQKTAAFFQKYGIPAPFTYSPEETKDSEKINHAYPLIIKPLNGMGSEGVFKVYTPKELNFFLDYVKNPIVQSCALGTEYTIDVLCDFQGEPVYVVPRVRMEVRSGEVVKSKTVHHPRIQEETCKLLKALNQEGRVIGPMTIQCFWEEATETLEFIEINPRFGGGVPLSFEAGADYAGALWELCHGNSLKYTDTFRELTMLRYDRAVFLEDLDGNEEK